MHPHTGPEKSSVTDLPTLVILCVTRSFSKASITGPLLE